MACGAVPEGKASTRAMKSIARLMAACPMRFEMVERATIRTVFIPRAWMGLSLFLLMLMKVLMS
jgi:hypothetical protein